MGHKRTTALLTGRLAVAVIVGAVSATTLGVLPATAQSVEDKLREQLRATVTQLRQIQDDQAALQAQKAAAEQERDALKAQLAAAKAQLAHVPPRNNGPSPEIEAELAKYKAAYAQVAGNVQQVQTAHDKLQTDLATSQNLLSACETKNNHFVVLSREILASYESFDFRDALGVNEPLIGIERVELENLAQDYDDRIGNEKFDPRTVRPPAAETPNAKTNR